MPPSLSASFLSSISSHNQFEFQSLQSRKRGLLFRNFSFIQCKFATTATYNTCILFGCKSRSGLRFIERNSFNSSDQFVGEENIASSVLEDQQQGKSDELESPWEGAIIYKRTASISHVEYCTTLERLGLGELSTDVSKSRASVMGLRVTKDVKDFPLGTPVFVSIDVTRNKQKLRLDGIIKTVLTLECNRCCGPAAEPVFSNFSFLLTVEPVEDPDTIDMGVIFGTGNFKSSSGGSDEDEEDEALIGLDDRLHFPLEQKEIDISKQIRDMLHIEITINAICDPSCKGVCLKCGTDLNKDRCDCGSQDVKEKGYGGLGNLKEQMQPK